jgi:hypothetical protein
MFLMATTMAKTFNSVGFTAITVAGYRIIIEFPSWQSRLITTLMSFTPQNSAFPTVSL